MHDTTIIRCVLFDVNTIKYATENAQNIEFVKLIIEKARSCNGLTYYEALTLLKCDDIDILNEIFKLSEEIKLKIYGKRIVTFAPLYLSNYCVNGCRYCSYHYSNCNIKRKQLTQDEIIQETIALQDMGHKRLVLETGEDEKN